MEHLGQHDQQGALPGVATSYHDGFGQERHLSDEAAEALRRAMRLDERDGASEFPRVLVVAQGQTTELGCSGQLVLEDGNTWDIDRVLPADTPLGYHHLHSPEVPHPMRVIVAPSRCHELTDRIWGWAVQLYAVRSQHSWGMGDLADLRALAHWARGLGGGMLQINPLGAVAPGLPQATSPYYPSSRQFLNPLYLRIEEVPGAAAVADQWRAAAEQARLLNADRLINRDAIYDHKLSALEAIWQQYDRHDRQWQQFVEQHGTALHQFATYCVLAESHGGDWRLWPESLRHPTDPAVLEYARAHQERVQFHQWLQYLLDLQLRDASVHLPLVFDLPVGVDPGGVDAWCWQDVLALEARIGAPPDQFNAEGQDWGLPPWIPHRLTEAQYEPYIQTVRASLRYAGGLRIDHVMGLFRLFWIPPGMSADQGTYVQYPAEDLLAILALESQRAQAWIAGEDLGTVPSGMRDDLERYGILSHRLMWFEDAWPRDYPAATVAAITTHDLPTVAGLWSGEDMAAELRIGRPAREEAFREMRHRLQRFDQLPDDATVVQAIESAYRHLGQAPSRVRLASLEDILAVTERPNMPGTIHQWPNWCLALPTELESLQTHPVATQIATALGG